MFEQLINRLVPLLAKVREQKAVQDLENRYYNLPDRDRMAVNVLGVVLAIFLVYQLVIASGLSYLGDARDEYRQRYDDYHWMQKVAPKVKKSAEDGMQQRSGSLLSIASSTAKEYSLSFNRFEPIGEDRVRLYLEGVQFNNVVLWLGKLESEMGVSAVDINVDSSAPGIVNVRLTLQG